MNKKFYLFKIVVILIPSIVFSQEPIKKSLNLEDISIKGELLSDSRMSLIKRKKEELKNRVKFRTQYHEEILQEYNAP